MLIDGRDTIQRGSMRGTLRRLREAGYTRDSALELLARICIIPVFTAHPTEVARRSVMFKRRRISDLLEQLDRLGIPPVEFAALERDLLAEITALWQTDDVRDARPTVRDEIRMGLDYYEASIFSTIPVLYGEMAAALDAEFPPRDSEAPTQLSGLPTLIRFGSWIGGDRDGNPFVTASTTEDALAMARNLLLLLLCRAVAADRLRATRLLATSGAHLAGSSRTPQQLSRPPASHRHHVRASGPQ